MLGGPRAPDDTNAPDTELIVGTPQAGAFLAFYNELRRAERYAPGIAKRTRRFGGAVERHGKLTILWVRGKDSHDAKRIRSCAGA